MLDRLAELDADHATACDVYDLATTDLEQARKDLTEAARRLADAEERWARAGIVADETNRSVIAAREAAGCVLTAAVWRRTSMLAAPPPRGRAHLTAGKDIRRRRS